VHIYDADDPGVLAGTYDREGFTPRERRALERRRRESEQYKTPDSRLDDFGVWRCRHCGLVQPCGRTHPETAPTERPALTMRLFDLDTVGCYLDAIDHRLEKTKDGTETKVIDLTLRVQPLTPELAAALDPDVRALLFTLGDARPKPKIKAVQFALTIPRQSLTVHRLPELDGSIVFSDCEIGDVRARTEKGVDGLALIFYAAYGPASPRDLEYVCDWHTQQRFVTFHPQAPTLDFAGADAPEDDAPPAPPRRGRRGSPAVGPGDELRPGVAAEH
jgi:hypothetical protein